MAWDWLCAWWSGSPSGPPVMRAVVASTGDPYRDDPGGRVVERAAEPRTLAQLVAALTAAGLTIRRRRRGFELRGGGGRVVRVRVRDAARVVPSDLVCVTETPELLLDLALALVPELGAVQVDLPYAGRLIVDGTRDRRALGELAAVRVQEYSRRMLRRAPISSSALMALARRMRGGP